MSVISSFTGNRPSLEGLSHEDRRSIKAAADSSDQARHQSSVNRGTRRWAASPDSGVNTLTGEGLAAAVEGASVVADVSKRPLRRRRGGPVVFRNINSPSPRRRSAAGVEHHVAVVSRGDGAPVR